MEQYYHVLKKVPLFKGVENDLTQVLHCLEATMKTYNKNNIIFSVGDTIESIGIVLSGKVKVIKEDLNGNENIMAQFSTSEFFGEAFACANTLSLVSVIAVEPSIILFINCKKITTMCSNGCIFHHKLIENLLSLIAKRNIMLSQKIEYISKRTIREKVFAYLETQKNMTNSNEFIVPFSREELADYLCVDRSSLSRELGKMKDEGLIDFNKNQFKLINGDFYV